MKGIIPRINLGPVVIRVKWAKDEEMLRLGNCTDGEAPDGLWDGSSIIYLHVRLKRKPRYARQILLHELIHACCDAYHQVT